MTLLEWIIDERRQPLTNQLTGRDIAELEIEARRDAAELQDVRTNPYEPGSFESACYIDELQKRGLYYGFQRQ